MQDEQPSNPPPDGTWTFHPEGSASASPTGNDSLSSPHAESISWTASEFIAHEKDFSWFALLGVGTGLLTVVTYLVTRDIVSTVVVLIVAVTFGAFAVRKPRVLQYSVDTAGIHVGTRFYPYEMFKSFSLIQEGGIRSIMLMSLKRFMPPLSLYVDPADEDRIITVLADYLPLEEREQDLLDRLMRRLRF